MNAWPGDGPAALRELSAAEAAEWQRASERLSLDRADDDAIVEQVLHALVVVVRAKNLEMGMRETTALVERDAARAEGLAWKERALKAEAALGRLAYIGEKLRTVVIVGLALSGYACTQTIDVAAPTVIIDNSQHGGGTQASPSPGSGTQYVYGSKISEFGERGPNAPANGPREGRIGNTSDVTCSPTDASGAEIKGNASRHSLVAFRQLGGTGAGRFDQDGANAYNGEVFCETSGVVVLECSLRDVATGTVVTGGDGGNRNTPWSMNCVPEP